MKINVILNKKNEIVGYRTYPLDLAEPSMEAEEFPKDLKVGNYRYENHAIVKPSVKSIMEGKTIIPNPKFSKDKLLKAFAEYRNNVNYGLVAEDENTHQKMINWYKAVNSNDIDSMNHPPQVIIEYLEADSWI